MQNILKIFFVAITILFSSIIFALPSPKDIQSAMEDGNFSKAESMLREVIAEKPQSAKAHYELGQVLARKEEFKEAYKELLKAKEIDPTLSFASNQKKFNDILEKVAQQRQTTGISGNPSPGAIRAGQQFTCTHTHSGFKNFNGEMNAITTITNAKPVYHSFNGQTLNAHYADRNVKVVYDGAVFKENRQVIKNGETFLETRFFKEGDLSLSLLLTFTLTPDGKLTEILNASDNGGKTFGIHLADCK